jgi:hypothetical protein
VTNPGRDSLPGQIGSLVDFRPICPVWIGDKAGHWRDISDLSRSHQRLKFLSKGTSS